MTTTTLTEDIVTTETAGERPLLTIKNLRKQFTRANGQLVTAVDGINLDIAKGEFIVLLGPSGCGKTTLLRCIGGLETASEGVIEIGETIAVMGQGVREPDPDAAAKAQGYRGGPPTRLRLGGSARHPILLSDAVDTLR